MKTLIVYDSRFGNTEKIAKVLKLSIPGFVMLRKADKVNLSELSSVELLIVGSPTWGGRPTQAVLDLLNSIPDDFLKGIKVAAFDTRFAREKHGLFLKFLMGLIGFAGDKIAPSLIKKGGKKTADTLGVIVSDKEGPLAKGETERAVAWAEKLN